MKKPHRLQQTLWRYLPIFTARKTQKPQRLYQSSRILPRRTARHRQRGAAAADRRRQASGTNYRPQIQTPQNLLGATGGRTRRKPIGKPKKRDRLRRFRYPSGKHPHLETRRSRFVMGAHPADTRPQNRSRFLD